jgi:hypothetical protein
MILRHFSKTISTQLAHETASLVTTRKGSVNQSKTATRSELRYDGCYAEMMRITPKRPLGLCELITKCIVAVGNCRCTKEE